MPHLLLDTHVIIWFLSNSSFLSKKALSLIEEKIENNDLLYISSISLVEMTYLVEKGRVSNDYFEQLIEELKNETTFQLLDLDLEVSKSLQKIPRDLVPDMPDRIIAATALCHSLPLVTCDSKIKLAGVETIW